MKRYVNSTFWYIQALIVLLSINLFVQPSWMFICSLLLLISINFLVVVSFELVLKRFIQSSHAILIGQYFALCISLYAYGSYHFPHWFVASDSPKLHQADWLNLMHFYYEWTFRVLTVIISVAIFIVGRKTAVYRYLKVLPLYILIVVSGNKAFSYYQTATEYIPMEKPNLLASNSKVPVPDIYYIVHDNYSGNKGLQKYWNYNNKAFTDTLNQLGFIIPEYTASNTNATIGVISAMLNLSTFNETKKCAVNMDYITTQHIYKNHLFDFLRQHGYHINCHSIFFEDKPFFFSQADIAPEFEVFETFLTRHLFMRIVLRVNRWFTNNAYGEINWYYDYDKRIEQAEKYSLNHIDSTPTFYYFHHLYTHPIYRYNSKGEPVGELKKDFYIDQIKMANTHILSYVQQLISKYQAINKPLLIFLHADHGSRENSSEEEDKEVLLGVYNSKKPIVLSDSVYLINAWRESFNQSFQLNLPSQPFSYYYFPF
ncbi:MAG: hypothetical protein MUC81_05600 [Bacteroidia bacterium]|jgi:hypothetical protein|nr:hypothetical protein [Bacteroidia bacterium]